MLTDFGKHLCASFLLLKSGYSNIYSLCSLCDDTCYFCCFAFTNITTSRVFVFNVADAFEVLPLPFPDLWLSVLLLAILGFG